MNLFSLKSTYAYVKLRQEHAGDSGYSRKNRFWGQNGQKYANFDKIFKKMCFLVILTMKMIFPEKTTNPSVFLA